MANVIKRNGSEEVFDIQKIVNALIMNGFQSMILMKEILNIEVLI